MRQLLAVEFAFVAYFQVSRGDVGHASTGVSSSTAKVVRECSMRGVCGHRGAMHQTCPYHGPPLRISVEKHRQTLASLCPHLFQGKSHDQVGSDGTGLLSRLAEHPLQCLLFGVKTGAAKENTYLFV
ncbi:hypothetical protein WUBG_08032 [Wuchereria bancrofti]|uniref:Uncharacterized protein n=1 Tax=Wuchereria bancrofti TaxID=6293 RepID=J9B2C2_WUCBA|nr:hypothetical protein WUBG_08032 [Wuchereria bancrofti]